MKKFLFCVFTISLFACSSVESDKVETKTEQSEEQLAENKQTLNLKVEGMVCAKGCAKMIEDKVGGLDGVFASTVSFVEGTAQFEFDANKINQEEIQQYISEIHDGQYSTSLKEEQEEKLEEEASEESEVVEAVSVKQIPKIVFPKLLTFFLNKI